MCFLTSSLGYLWSRHTRVKITCRSLDSRLIIGDSDAILWSPRHFKVSVLLEGHDTQEKKKTDKTSKFRRWRGDGLKRNAEERWKESRTNEPRQQRAEVRGDAFVRLRQRKPEPSGADLRNHFPKLNLVHHKTERSSKEPASHVKPSVKKDTR